MWIYRVRSRLVSSVKKMATPVTSALKNIKSKLPKFANNFENIKSEGWDGIALSQTVKDNEVDEQVELYGYWKYLGIEKVKDLDIAKIEVEWFDSDNPVTKDWGNDILGKKVYFHLGKEKNYNHPCLVYNGELYLKWKR